MSQSATADLAPVYTHPMTQRSPEWYTPPYVVEAAREALGGVIDLDPASCEAAQRVVLARDYYDEGDDGLRREWRGRVFINPPGNVRSAALLWWEKLAEEVGRGHVSAFVFLGYNIRVLQTLQAASTLKPVDCVQCVPRRRIAYLDGTGKPQAGTPAPSVLLAWKRHATPRETSAIVGALSVLGETRA